MRRFRKIIVALCAVLLPASLSAWGGKGHQAVAKVAEYHLNEKAKKALDKYLEGRSLVDVTSDADVYRSEWLRDFGVPIVNPSDFRLSGWKDFDYDMPSHIEPWTHSFCVNDETRECFATDLLDKPEGKMGLNNCVLYIDRFSKEILAGVEKMRPDSLMIKICLMVHWLGDMHCPMHIQYYPDDMSKGGNIYYRGEKISLHNYWDSSVFTYAFSGQSYSSIATEADTFENPDFKAITAGDIWTWGPADAYQARAGRMLDGVRIPNNTVVPENFDQIMRPVCLRQIRDGGFRLAALMNHLFGGE